MMPFANPEQARFKRVKVGGLLLRFLAFVLCAAALIAMVTSRQVITAAVAIPGLQNMGLENSADYGYSEAFTFVITATAISAAYALLQGVRSVTTMSLGLRTGWFTLLGDQVITYLLLAAGAAATEVVYTGEKGQRTAVWIAQCVIFSKFCKHVVASILFTFLAAIVFSLSTIVSAYELFHRYR